MYTIKVLPKVTLGGRTQPRSKGSGYTKGNSILQKVNQYCSKHIAYPVCRDFSYINELKNTIELTEDF